MWVAKWFRDDEKERLGDVIRKSEESDQRFGRIVDTTFAAPDGMAKAADSSELKNPVVSKTETTWDRVVFGSYYSEAGKDVPITWRVLNVQWK